MILPPPGLTTVRYVNVLRPHVTPMRRQMRRDFILIQDNARSHVAVRDCLKVNNIELLLHLTNSVDINSVHPA